MIEITLYHHSIYFYLESRPLYLEGGMMSLSLTFVAVILVILHIFYQELFSFSTNFCHPLIFLHFHESNIIFFLVCH